MEGERDADRDDGDDDRAEREAAQDRSRNQEHPKQGERERGPAEHHGAGGRTRDIEDCLAVREALGLLLAQPVDDDSQ